jgi:GTP cyclohydrolase FolE2
MPDVQAEPDERGVALDEVGISGIRYPVAVADREEGKQNTVADISLSVALDGATKGAHLSRFVELLHEQSAELTPSSVVRFAELLRQRLHSSAAEATVRYVHFRGRTAPVSGATGLLDYAVTITGRSSSDDRPALSVEVRAPVTSVCPCSKAISDYGAHNQRGYVTVTVSLRRNSDGAFPPLWVEELIDLAESAGSSPVYPVLKRSDERYVTMRGYEHPVFVEDMVRHVAVQLRDDDRFAGWDVHALNDESIHNHAAYARARDTPAGTRSRP